MTVEANDVMAATYIGCQQYQDRAAQLVGDWSGCLCFCTQDFGEFTCHMLIVWSTTSM